MTEFSNDSVALIAIAFVLPIIIAARRNHAHSQAIALVNFGFAFLVLFSSHLGLPVIPPIIALPVWIGLTIWAAAGSKNEQTPQTPAVPNNPPITTDKPRYDPNRHLPEKIQELDKLAVKIRKAIKAPTRPPNPTSKQTYVV